MHCNIHLINEAKTTPNYVSCCQEDETVSHLLCEYRNPRKVYNFVSNVLHVADVISRDNVIFGVDLNSSMKYIVSIIVYYYIYKEWQICSFKNKIRRPDISHRSLITYLKIRLNVYSKSSDPLGIECVTN